MPFFTCYRLLLRIGKHLSFHCLDCPPPCFAPFDLLRQFSKSEDHVGHWVFIIDFDPTCSVCLKAVWDKLRGLSGHFLWFASEGRKAMVDSSCALNEGKVEDVMKLMQSRWSLHAIVVNVELDVVLHLSKSRIELFLWVSPWSFASSRSKLPMSLTVLWLVVLDYPIPSPYRSHHQIPFPHS